MSLSMLAFAAPAAGQTAEDSTADSAATGGAAYGQDPNAVPRLTVPGKKARLMRDG